MRLALISDMHGNHTALKAVLADIRRHAPDRIVCLGDVATIGPSPKLVLAELMALDADFVMGNHDEALLHPERAGALHVGAILNDSLIWAATQLDATERAFIAAFRQTITLPLAGGLEILCCHGSPRSNFEMVLATASDDELDAILGPIPPIWAGGHTHVQMLRRHHGRWLINPGSIGAPFRDPLSPGHPPELLPWAEYALLDTAPGTVRVQLQGIPIDVAAFQAEVAASDIPIKPWLQEQYSDGAPW